MLIALEGIDGAGKSSLARTIKEETQSNDKIIVVDKKDFLEHVPEEFRDDWKLLRDSLWDGKNFSNSPPPTRRSLVALFTRCGWFHLLSESLQEISKDKVVIVDSWFYKFQARYMNRSSFEKNIVERCFSSIKAPDQVIYLSVDPKIAAKRKKHFTWSECGGPDGFNGISLNNFIKYQQTQKLILEKFCKQQDWYMVDVNHQSMDTIKTQVVSKIETLFYDH